MAKGAYPEALQRVVAALSRWPGVGEKTAARLALFLLRAPDAEVAELVQALADLKEKVHLCRRCFAFADQEFCPLCANPARQGSVLMVVADPGDLLAIEKVGWYQGRYHVLGGVLSPLEGVGPDDLHIEELLDARHGGGHYRGDPGPEPQPGGRDHHHLSQPGIETPGGQGEPHRLRPPHGGDIKYADRDTLREALSYRVET